MTETKHQITLSKGGTAEKTVNLETLQIPDIWHIAGRQSDGIDREKILETWHMAHDLKTNLIEAVNQADERERKARAAAQAKLEKDQAETISKWLEGASGSIAWGITRVYLRTKDDCLETSKGAKVPLSEAHKAYRFARLHRTGWKQNGDRFTVGDYELNSVSEQGVIAGCHRIDWQEIERFAATQGWSQSQAVG